MRNQVTLLIALFVVVFSCMVVGGEETAVINSAESHGEPDAIVTEASEVDADNDSEDLLQGVSALAASHTQFIQEVQRATAAAAEKAVNTGEEELVEAEEPLITRLRGLALTREQANPRPEPRPQQQTRFPSALLRHKELFDGQRGEIAGLVQAQASAAWQHEAQQAQQDILDTTAAARHLLPQGSNQQQQKQDALKRMARLEDAVRMAQEAGHAERSKMREALRTAKDQTNQAASEGQLEQAVEHMAALQVALASSRDDKQLVRKTLRQKSHALEALRQEQRNEQSSHEVSQKSLEARAAASQAQIERARREAQAQKQRAQHEVLIAEQQRSAAEAQRAHAEAEVKHHVQAEHKSRQLAKKLALLAASAIKKARAVGSNVATHRAEKRKLAKAEARARAARLKLKRFRASTTAHIQHLVTMFEQSHAADQALANAKVTQAKLKAETQLRKEEDKLKEKVKAAPVQTQADQAKFKDLKQQTEKIYEQTEKAEQLLAMEAKVAEQYKKQSQQAITQVAKNVGQIPAGSLRHMGCFSDRRASPDLPHHVPMSMSSPARCAIACSLTAKHYNYIAMQQGNQCFCGTSYGKYGREPPSTCFMSCKKDSGKKCGGILRNSVYEMVLKPGVRSKV